jgi:protein-tyrosine phosphatase
MGSASDMQQAVDTEGISVVVDLRAESTGCAAKGSVKWIKVPLGDNSPSAEVDLFDQAIDEVIAAYKDGKKVAFHCGMGRGRTGTVAAGVLLRLGLSPNLAQAEEDAKAIRPEISIQPVQHKALEAIFG